MKYTLTLAIFAIYLTASSQPPLVEGKITYTEVIKIDSATSTELFTRAQSFFVNTYKDSKEVIQLSDPNTGEITGKGTIFIPSRGGFTMPDMYVRHKLTILVKDGKYKYMLTDFNTTSSGKDQPLEVFMDSKHKVYKNFTADVDAKAKSLAESLKAAMNKKKEDW